MKQRTPAKIPFLAKAALYGTATLATGFALNSKLGPLPALGKLLSPTHGIWRNAAVAHMQASQPQEILNFAPLQASVRVLYDERAVPHVFAENDADLSFAQGYVTARDRLWQMEIQVRATAGRVSEVLGPSALEFDKTKRRLGMTTAAQTMLETLQKDETTWRILTAYTAGVNAYIQSLGVDDRPVEYKILDSQPEAWTPLKTALLIKQMAWDLTGKSEDLRHSNGLAKFGHAVFRDLFPVIPNDIEPIIPKGEVFNTQPLTLKEPSTFVPPSVEIPAFDQPNGANGSNNWAVSANKSSNGFPILSNDPHLELRLPSIWYEMQLNAPGLNAYGVTLPGAPGIVIGFNSEIAWGVTNAGIDVADWYQIKFKDEARTEYWHDGQWKKTRIVREEIKIRGASSQTLDVVYTHHGPISFDAKPKATPGQGLPPTIPLAFRWLAHDPSNELRALYDINRATNYDAFVKALEKFSCPAQNFAVITRTGDVALWHNGSIPKKWPGQGLVILDGTDASHDWQTFVPHVDVPHMKNPQRGFVSSANQNPTDATYPHFLAGAWMRASSARGKRINEFLASKDKVTVGDMRSLLNDTADLQAKSVLPTLLSLLESNGLSASEASLQAILSAWNFDNAADLIAPTFFQLWWKSLQSAIWDDDFEPHAFQAPSGDRTIQLIVEQQTAPWYDNTLTPETETLSQLVNQTFKETYATLEKENGPQGPNWHWGKVRGTDLRHLGRIPGLGVMRLPTGGSGSTVNATKKTHGPSWRMVVTFDDAGKIQAWGTYPGGQSGDPGSPYYDNFVNQWTKGELSLLRFLDASAAYNETEFTKHGIRTSIVMSPLGGRP